MLEADRWNAAPLRRRSEKVPRPSEFGRPLHIVDHSALLRFLLSYRLHTPSPTANRLEFVKEQTDLELQPSTPSSIESFPNYIPTSPRSSMSFFHTHDGVVSTNSVLRFNDCCLISWNMQPMAKRMINQ